MRTYIAGPMTGIKFFNFYAFDEAAEWLRSEGYDPISPADIDRDHGFDPFTLPIDYDWSKLPPVITRQDIVLRDMMALSGCDAIYMLDGWEDSVGAKAELATAEWLGLEVMYEVPPGKARPPQTDAEARKQMPIASGVLDYFPDAIRAVAHCSWVGNEQHNPGEPLHWSRGKSDDHADCLMRHFVERGTIDSDKVRHSTKVTWRALALLQLEIEASWKDGSM